MRISDWSSDVCSSDLDVHSELVGSIFWRPPLNNVKQICMLLLRVAGQLGAALHELMKSLQDREVTTALVVFAILLPPSLAALGSSEGRRVGNACVSSCRYRWWPDH